MKPIVLLCAALLAAPVSAETFSVSLGGKALGQLSYSEVGNKSTLSSTVDNTPLGVFNGTFTGTSTGSSAKSLFTGDSRSSRKQRVVKVNLAKGRATSTDVTPAEEQTELSDVARVPADVMDPVRAMGQLFRAKGCPAPIQMYDGRRVVSMRSDIGTKTAGTLTCNLRYKVIAGPGHLSPLGISSAKMQLSYSITDGGQNLQQMKVSSGIFGIRLDREN
ncbi:hypothetical protein [Sulfitobacter sp.]|uniref:hypothetical protein n=1 Tax=Sulfitobacter sp. TaxID=1903071 RepID=UPI00300271C6